MARASPSAETTSRRVSSCGRGASAEPGPSLALSGRFQRGVNVQLRDTAPPLPDTAPQALGFGTSWQIPAPRWQRSKSPTPASIGRRYQTLVRLNWETRVFCFSAVKVHVIHVHAHPPASQGLTSPHFLPLPLPINNSPQADIKQRLETEEAAGRT